MKKETNAKMQGRKDAKKKLMTLVIESGKRVAKSGVHRIVSSLGQTS